MKYNGNEISENLNAIIKKNLFDYTFKTFVYEIFYDDLLIGKANCNFDSNKIILTCENINFNFPLRLYSYTDCGGKEDLDFLVYSYSKPNDNI